MRAAPAFELHVTPGRGEPAALAMVGGVCAVVLDAWLWSHIDAAAGPAGHGAAAWLAVSVAAAALGVGLGWLLAPRTPCTLAWRQGQWTLCRRTAPPSAGTVQTKLDFGSWMLLCFRAADGRGSSWLAVSGRDAGPSWRALRATVFAPGSCDVASDRDEGVRP
jgi:hypothetical protein